MKISKVKGRPMLHWVGKKPIEAVEDYPAQLTETVNAETVPTAPTFELLQQNWSNLLFHGDNKEVLSTLLVKGFRGKIDLIYIDPPFDSGADYVRKVELRGTKEKIAGEGQAVLEQVQYEDIWANDNYLQFMYERLTLLRELLAETGVIALHCDFNKAHQLRFLLDEVFGAGNFVNDITWFYENKPQFGFMKHLPRDHDTIFIYAKHFGKHTLNHQQVAVKAVQKQAVVAWDPIAKKRIAKRDTDGNIIYEERSEKYMGSVWTLPLVHPIASERTGYPTQKPEDLLQRIIDIYSNDDQLVMDCFIGSGTTAAVAQRSNRRWLGVDINKGAIQTTMKRLQKQDAAILHYRVNNYDFQEISAARDIIIEKYGIEPLRTDTYFDGKVGSKLVKIAELNKPITKLDVQVIIDELKSRAEETRDIVLVGSGVELGVAAQVAEYNKLRPVNKIEVRDIQADGIIVSDPAEADVSIVRSGDKAKVQINSYISPTIIKRLNIDRSIFGERIKDFRSQVDVVLVDTNYNGETFNITFSDVPARKQDLVAGEYNLDIPRDSKAVAVKVIDMLGEETLVVEQS